MQSGKEAKAQSISDIEPPKHKGRQM